MPKPNCNNGCVTLLPANCVRYSGPPILQPPIAQGADLNTVIKILASMKGDGPGNTSCARQVTYEELKAINETGRLVPGCWYQLTDFRTTHSIFNITFGPGESQYSLVDTQLKNTGPAEPLWLFATASQQDYYSGFGSNGDCILYSLAGFDYVIPGATTGAIVRRKDLVHNIDIPLDWRVVRWQVNGQPYQTFNGPDGNPQSYTSLTRNIYIGGGYQYKKFPIIIFTSDLPTHADIHITYCQALVISKAAGVNVKHTNVVMPNAGIYDVMCAYLGAVGFSEQDYGQKYDPAYNIS